MGYLTFAIFFLLMGCPKKDKPFPKPIKQQEGPTRVIFFLGDGMGLGSLTAATYASGDALAMTKAAHFGFITTHEYEFVTTDSAASATALATGKKTHFNGVSVVPGTTKENEHDRARHLKTWFEIAKERKLGTGIVSTSRVNHATPAAFVTHRATRRSYDDIAEDIVAFGPDVLLGSGSKYFNQRKDGKDLVQNLVSRGWVYTDTPEGLAQVRPTARKLAGLFYESDTPFLTTEPRAVPLPEMTDVAIEVLDRSYPKGWVLLVEGSFIDWCEHALDPKCTIAETLEFDEAVSRGLAYAQKRDDTLVVITADHETGGLSVIDPEYASRFEKILGGPDATIALAQLPDLNGKPRSIPDPVQHFPIADGVIGRQMSGVVDRRFTTVFGYLSVASAPYWKSEGRFYASHTAEAVPLFASGPYADWIAASRDNAEVGSRIKSLLEIGPPEVEKPVVERKKSKNLVIMIGDGMGIASVSATQYRYGSLNMFELPVHGMVATHTGDKLVADSAATATAIATGQISGRHRVGVDLAGKSHMSILERFQKNGRSVGIVTTTQVTHGTPAAFYAHTLSRSDKTKILHGLSVFADQYGAVDVLFGGGQFDFPENVQRKLRESGYNYETTWPPTLNGPLIVALSDAGLSSAKSRRDDNDPTTPTLAEMTEVALQRLSKNENGFVLVVEGGQIDWRLHERDATGIALEEIREFDDAVGLVKAFAEKNGDTTMIVTADHDHTLSVIDNHYALQSKRCGVASACGGPVVFPAIPVADIAGFSDSDLQGDYAAPKIHLQYAWLVSEAAKKSPIDGPHSAKFVPLFAYGPDAYRFDGFHLQAEIGQRLIEIQEASKP